MTEHLDYRNKHSLVRFVLAGGLSSIDRRVMCACVGLANEYGFLRPDPALIAPMSGIRRPVVIDSLRRLEKWEWITEVSDHFKLTIPLEMQSDDG